MLIIKILSFQFHPNVLFWDKFSSFAGLSFRIKNQFKCHLGHRFIFYTLDGKLSKKWFVNLTFPITETYTRKNGAIKLTMNLLNNLSIFFFPPEEAG